MSAPRRLGRYVVQRRIGAGGFATVWLGYDDQLDSPVAIKVLADNWSEDAHVRGRFVEEGRFLRKVDSPYVVPAYDAGELEDGRPFLVMAYADQGNLTDRLEHEPLPGPQALTVIRHIAQGLEALHERGVLHRDVKPGNVLFRSVDTVTAAEEVRAMLGDLGLGKALDGASRLTMIAGTPAYVSPEQARGEPLDRRSDLYSLAALAYLLLAGRQAFSHTTLTAAGFGAEPPSLGPDWPPALDEVIRRGLAGDREQRQASVEAFLTEFDAACADSDATTQLLVRIPTDPDLTLPGPRPSDFSSGGRAPAGSQSFGGRVPGGSQSFGGRVPPRNEAVYRDHPDRDHHPRRLRAAVVGTLATLVVAAGGIGGYLAQDRLPPTVTLSNEDGSISVTVPKQ